MKSVLTNKILLEEGRRFCEIQTNAEHPDLLGVNDGKTVGTHLERLFFDHLSERYEFERGSSARGVDFPVLNTDLKTTSIKQPQSSCPFRSAREKIYGLGTNLLIFAYEKNDEVPNPLSFKYCAYVDKSRTGDFTTTKRLRAMIDDGANKEDVVAYLNDLRLPGDETLYNLLAEEILANIPEQGYLTVSSALQWRLQYGRVLKLNNEVEGVVNYEW